VQSDLDAYKEVVYNWEDFMAALTREHMVMTPWYPLLSFPSPTSPASYLLCWSTGLECNYISENVHYFCL
jgi:hypothetical protein